MAKWSLVFWQKSSLRILFSLLHFWQLMLFDPGSALFKWQNDFAKKFIVCICSENFFIFFSASLTDFIIHQYRNSVEIVIFERSYKWNLASLAGWGVTFYLQLFYCLSHMHTSFESALNKYLIIRNSLWVMAASRLVVRHIECAINKMPSYTHIHIHLIWFSISQ